MWNGPSEGKSSRWWFLLLLAPFVGVLWVPFFNRLGPELWDIPFFFWYQFLWVIVSAVITALVYAKTAPRLKSQPTRDAWRNRR